MTTQEKNIILQDLRKKLIELKHQVRDTEEEIVRVNRQHRRESVTRKTHH